MLNKHFDLPYNLLRKWKFFLKNIWNSSAQHFGSILTCHVINIGGCNGCEIVVFLCQATIIGTTQAPLRRPSDWPALIIQQLCLPCLLSMLAAAAEPCVMCSFFFFFFFFFNHDQSFLPSSMCKIFRSSNVMASFLRCPVEVCDSILAYLPRTDLLNICLVHEDLRTIAEPYLYSDIQLIWEEKLQPHHITSLLCNLLRRPRLATYVRKVSLVGLKFHNYFDEKRAPKIQVPEDELEEVLAFVKKTTVPYRQIWLEELQNGTMDAFVAVLLSQPLRLTYLAIEDDFLWESRFIGLVLRSIIFDEPNASDSCGLRLDSRHLETVSLQTSTDRFRHYNMRNTADLLPIFYLPSIKHFAASVDNPLAFSWPGTHPPSPSGLRKLKLDYIREPFLGQLLSITDQLQSLDWRWYYFPDVYDQQYHERILDLTQIIKSISYVRDTLTELVLSAMNENNPDPLPLTIQGSIKGLTGFQKLTKLTIPRAFLMEGWTSSLTKKIEKYLPSSLQSLTITKDLVSNDEFEWDDHDFYILLKRWLKKYWATTPHLRDLTVMTEEADENTDDVQEIPGLSDRVKIRFLVPPSPRRGGRPGYGPVRIRPRWY